MSKEILNQLYFDSINDLKVILTEEQKQKFLIACEKAYSDNATYYEQLKAAKLFLKMILEFPSFSL